MLYLHISVILLVILFFNRCHDWLTCFTTSSLTDATIRYGSLMYGRKVVPKCQVYCDHKPSKRNCSYKNNSWSTHSYMSIKYYLPFLSTKIPWIWTYYEDINIYILLYLDLYWLNQIWYA